MNCPHHCEIYKTQQWSYKDLPKDMQNLEPFTDEQSGELRLNRVRGFTQDDAHLFCTPDQLLRI
jgi:threonyl-tRNA synthetase